MASCIIQVNVECFKSDERIVPDQLPGCFPLPGQTLIGDASVKTHQITLRPSVVGRAFLLTGKNAMKSFHGLQVLLKEFRTLNGCFVRAGKVSFQTEVQADCITQPWKNLICCLIFNCETKPKIVHRITFHREGLDLSFDLSGLEILIFLSADDKLIAVKQFVTRLLECKRLSSREV